MHRRGRWLHRLQIGPLARLDRLARLAASGNRSHRKGSRHVLQLQPLATSVHLHQSRLGREAPRNAPRALRALRELGVHVNSKDAVGDAPKVTPSLANPLQTGRV